MARFLCMLALVACSTAKPQTDAGADAAGAPRSFTVTVSGEDLAVEGYDFVKGMPSQKSPPQFVDGWAVRFDHWIITVGKVRLSADPDKNPGDAKDVGPIVAEDTGAYAVDVVIGGPLVGKSGSPNEKTVRITTLSASRLDDKQRYAFSYDLVTASASATQVNLDAAGKALYQQAIAQGWSMAIEGKATYKGDPGAGVFAKMPPEVKFTLGLKNPSSYVNCRNTDLNQVMGEFPRGVQPDPAKPVVVQITMHTNHLFWDELNVEGTPLHFDPFAAVSSTYGASGPGAVGNAELATLDVTGFKTKDGENLDWRSLVPDYAAPAGQMNYKTNGTSLSPANSFLSFLAYSAASGGHMNADGECEIVSSF